MTDLHDDPEHDDRSTRPRYRVPVGMPLRDDGRRAGALVSVLVHAALITLLIVPFFLPSSVIERMQQGAGGPGPAGGGGGGRRGDNGARESLRFVRLGTDPVPTPKSLPPVPVQTIAPPVIPPMPKPITPAAVPPPPQSAAPAASAQPLAAASPGNTGGSGRDGTSGAGPGSGGGVGAGVGTGKGSSTGAGTGGGTQGNYPPEPTELFLPPLPSPSDVHGFRFIAQFDVDSTGRVLGLEFTPTPNGDYNRRIATVLRSMRFKPGTRPDGTPIRMKAQLVYGL